IRINMSTGLPPPNYACPGKQILALPFIKGYEPTYPGDCDFYPPETDFKFSEDFEPFNFDSFE
ncbi:MAG: hypothetical protein ACRCXK_09040, partial [Wohlfahrtiimonas sp.]